MKLKFNGCEPICHKDCEHFKEPHWCARIYPPARVDYQFTPPCIWGVRQQRDALLSVCKKYTDEPEWDIGYDRLRWLGELLRAIKKAEGKS